MNTVIAKQDAAPMAWGLVAVLTAMLLGNNIFTKITLLVCVVYFGYKTRQDIPSILTGLFRKRAILALYLWAVLSISWSVVPKVTLDMVSGQCAFLALCVLMARYSAGKDIDRSLKLVALLVIATATLFALLYPEEAISAQGFKAFYANKNGLGSVMAICLLILICSVRPRARDYVFALLALALLLMSRSKTSISVFGVIMLTLLTTLLFRKWYGRLSDFARGLVILLGNSLLVIAYGAIAAMVVFRDQVAGYLIKVLPYDFLTGRGELWVTVLRRTETDLLHGLGPGSFWGAGRLSEIAQTSLLTKYPFWIDRLGAADGGYIDLVGSLGFIGLALLLCTVVDNYRQLVRHSGVVNWRLPLALFTMFVLHNITETTIYHSFNALWFLYLYSSFHVMYAAETAQAGAAGLRAASPQSCLQGLRASYE